jgi:hypothetical protein
LTGSVEDERFGGISVFHDATLDVTCLGARAPIEDFAGGFSL